MSINLSISRSIFTQHKKQSNFSATFSMNFHWIYTYNIPNSMQFFVCKVKQNYAMKKFFVLIFIVEANMICVWSCQENQPNYTTTLLSHSIIRSKIASEVKFFLRFFFLKLLCQVFALFWHEWKLSFLIGQFHFNCKQCFWSKQMKAVKTSARQANCLIWRWFKSRGNQMIDFYLKYFLRLILNKKLF